MGLTRAEKVMDVRLRQTAKRRGFALHRSRRRDPKAVDYARYTVEDLMGRGLTRTGLTLLEVNALFADEMWPPLDE